MRRFRALFVLGLALAPVLAVAGNCGDDRQETPFFRNDLAALKDHMRAAIGALGQPPVPYAKESERWSLPSYVCSDKSGFIPVSVSYEAEYTIDAQQKKLTDSYQKQVMAAQARGDYQAITALAQQMQAQAMQQSMANQGKTPIRVSIRANESAGQTIDPDSVFRDGVGFIALKNRRNGISSGEQRIVFYFDKVDLKDAQRLASFQMGNNQRVPGKLDITGLRVELSGPTAEVEAIAKQLDADAVLKQLASQRSQAAN